MLTTRLISIVLISTFALVTHRPAVAAERPRPAAGDSTTSKANEVQRAAQLHHNAGIESYLAGRYDHAISELEKAYALVPDPILLFNIAQAHRKKGANEKALGFYRRYLKEAPQAPDRPDVERRIDEIEDALRAASDPTRPVVPAPEPLRLVPPPPPTVARPRTMPAPQQGDTALAEGSESDDATGGQWKTVAGVVAIVAGGAAVAVGTWLLVRDPAPVACNAPAGAECNESSAKRPAAGWAALGAGGLAAVLGGVLVYQGRDTAATATALRDGGLMTLAGRF
jgi:tetratricopeptide (TPR) repeat protein